MSGKTRIQPRPSTCLGGLAEACLITRWVLCFREHPDLIPGVGTDRVMHLLPEFTEATEGMLLTQRHTILEHTNWIEWICAPTSKHDNYPTTIMPGKQDIGTLH